ncbi:MAG: hypothetical protein DRP29_09325, partial [Thermodesulfobacteriota bacterium]
TDKEEYLPDSQDVYFWITTDGNLWDSGTNKVTNSTGHASDDFYATCSYDVMSQKWKVGTVNNNYYFDTNSTNYTLHIWSHFEPYILEPINVSVLRGSNLLIKTNMTDNCGGIDNPSSSTLAVERGGFTSYCTPIYGEGSGIYNCTWTTTGRSLRWWNITFSASKSHYVSNSTKLESAFFLATKPELDNPSVDPNVGGWGENFEFTIYLTDRDSSSDDQANISLWKRKWGESSWTLLASKQDYGVSVEVNFDETFACEDIKLSQYKFNVTDTCGTSDGCGYTNESIILNFTIEKDNVTVSKTFGDIVDVTRGNSQKFEVRVWDSDRGEYIGNGYNCSFWITEDGSLFTVLDNTTSNSQGYCAVFHTPDCNTGIGPQKWVGGVFDDMCYSAKNSTQADFDAYGSLAVTVLSPENATNVAKWQQVWFNSTVNDSLCGEFVNDGSVEWRNESNGLLASGYNTTWGVPVDYKTGATQIYAHATRQYYNPGTSDNVTLYVFGWSRIGEIYPINGSNYLAGTLIPVECYVRDADSNLTIEDYNVKFYKNGYYNFTDNTNGDGKATWAWNTNDELAGYYNISCNITNDTVKYYYVTSDMMNWTTIKIDRPLIITDIIRSETTIYRNDSYSPNESVISVKVDDAIVGPSENANVTFYNASGHLFDYCLTNSSGWCNGTYNPHDSISPDIYTIYINATKTGQDPSVTNSTQITVKGVLVINITSPDENSTYSKAQSIPLVLEVKDENNNQISATVNWYDQFNQKIAQGVSTNWLPTEAVPGYQNITSKATKTYYDDGNDVVWLTINSIADVYVYEPSQDDIFSYPDNVTIKCKVEDHYSYEGIENYAINLWYNRTTLDIYHIATINASSNGFVEYNWTPTDKGNTTFMCNISDDADKYYVAGQSSDAVMAWVKDSTPPWFKDSLIIPNQSIE